MEEERSKNKEKGIEKEEKVMNFLMQQKKDKENGLLGWGTCKAKGEGLVSQTLTFKKLLPLISLYSKKGRTII